MLSSSMLSKSHSKRSGSMHMQRQTPRNQERERGRSRTPKPTAITLEFRRQEPPRHVSHTRVGSEQHPRSYHVDKVPARQQRQPPAKAKSPDRSIPGSLEAAIHEAHAQGNLRQCLQWVLEIQGVYLDWDDPRLDTVTEDDLCFAEQTGMGPNATPEERKCAEAYWAMRQAEEDEAQRVWELTASPAEKLASRRLRGKYEAEQRKREARMDFFRAPRTDKALPIPVPEMRPAATRSSLSKSMDASRQRSYTIPRTTRSQPQALFPVDEGELTAVRSMWLDQGRKGLTLVEALVRLPAETPREVPVASSSDARDDKDSDDATPSCSASTSASSSAPSALFSSVTTTASSATSVSTMVASSESTQSEKLSTLPKKEVETSAASPKLTPVPSSESPLHKHLAEVTLRRMLEEDDAAHHSSVPVTSPATHTPRRRRAASESWLAKGSKTVGGLVDLVGRLPTAYLPLSDRDASPVRTTSCPPSARRSPAPSLINSSTATPQPETIIYLLPLRPPSIPLKLPPVPTLPGSPYRPLTPPPRPTPRPRCVANPQYLRLKALQNSVLWGLVSVPRYECDILADIARRHRMDGCPGRQDVDRLGQMFTAREALMRVAVEGAGKSKLRQEYTAVPEGSAGLWGWWTRG